ncbi:MAG TPA: protein kinase [Blastocatellia bacterium]|nr:protein kinase [Blastocatellia bacterium]
MDQARADEPDFLKEIEALLAADEESESLIESLASEPAPDLLSAPATNPWMGKAIGPYRITARLGSGGMGEVYLAEDTRLDREVALKLLPDNFAKDEIRARRFKQEASAASALCHPNVATIYEIGEAESTTFIAMEYIKGQTLSAQLGGRPLAPDAIIDIAAQVTDALDEAHNRGIVHRDITSANIMVTARGQVKVLDFGLAKVEDSTQRKLSSEMNTRVQTEPGMVMGTVRYMSPEQALGKEVDHRSDLFSLGVVMYEMATGRLPFSGSTPAEIIDRISHAQPEAIARFNYDVPAELEHIIRKCLEKDCGRRYQRARELLVDLRNLQRDRNADAAAVGRKRSGRYLVAVAIMVVAAVAASHFWFRPKATPRPIRSIAVLPFKSLDPNEEDPSLGLKLADALIMRLGRLRQITVRSTRAVLDYEGKAVDPLAAGREQQVDVVFDGSFQRAGQRLQVRARLLRASDGQQLWAGIFDERGSDPFALQDALAEQAAEALLPQLTGAERQLVVRHDTENLEANRLYTEARYYWNKRNFEGIRKSVKLLEQAIELDPNYARAHAGLADSYITLSDYYLLEPAVAFPKAKQEAQKALEIDGSLAEAHAALAMIKSGYEWDWAGADHAFRQAIEINPHYATAHQWYAEFLSGMGRHEQALREIRLAQQLDPLSLIIPSIEALVLYYGRDYEGAIAQCQRVISRDPNFGEVYGYLGHVFEQKGMYREAMDTHQKCMTFLGYDTPEAAAIRAAPVLHARDYWQKIVKLSSPPTGGEIEAAQAMAQLGRADEALALLEQACARRGYGVIYLGVEPNLDPLRSDPRFTDLLRRVGLAQ